ncbi:hypothetical protein ACOSQ3_028311 [Xanthoceras sorbifolium]
MTFSGYNIIISDLQPLLLGTKTHLRGRAPSFKKHRLEAVDPSPRQNFLLALHKSCGHACSEFLGWDLPLCPLPSSPADSERKTLRAWP